VYQASLSYPSEIVPILELALTLVAALLVLCRPRRLDGPLRAVWRRLARLGPRRAVLTSATFGLLASAASMTWLGSPVPRVSDELGYLLVADTFAHGRLTNPTPRVPEAFEAVHVVVRPSYSSKYPPGPAVLLAVGQRLGHPAIGICLGAALLAAASCWFLQGWVPAPWPLVGSVLLALRVGVGSYWGQSYWGGVAAAVGGLLVYGALPRLRRRNGSAGRLAWGPLAIGVLLLATSRPFEGALAVLPAAVVIGAALLRHWRHWFHGRPRRREVVALALALVAAGAIIGAYNRAVTGNPLRMPYQLHVVTYGVDAMSPYFAPPPPVPYSSHVLRAHLAKDFPRPQTWQEALAKGAGDFARMIYFVCGLPLMIFAVLALRGLARDRRLTRWKLFALLCSLLPALLHTVTAWWSPHYSAAATGPLLLLAVLGMREASAVRWRGRRLGPWLAAGALLVRVPMTILELPAFRPDPGDSSRFVQELQRDFASRGERAVVVVDDRLRAVEEWVYNRADLERAPVLWIQDLGPGVTARVAAAYAPRRVYRLVPDEDGGWPRLIPARQEAPR